MIVYFTLQNLNMYQSLTYLIITTLLTEKAIKGQEVITGIWNDDFAYDTSGVNGWQIYNTDGGETFEDYLGNIYVTGNNNRKYHGRFTKKTDTWNAMIRDFQCALSANVRIQYSFTFCRTEDADQTYLLWLNGVSNFAFNDGFGSGDDFNTYETGNTWNNNLPTGDTYPGGIHLDCDSTNGFKYKNTGWINMGVQNEKTTYKVTMWHELSASDEDLYIYNFQLWCDPGPTSSPTPEPTTAPTPAPT
eukprot:455902_1